MSSLWERFLQRIVTADETSVRNDEPECKTQSMVWKHLSSLEFKKFRRQPSAGKIMLTLFWDMEGEVALHVTPEWKLLTVGTIVMCYEQSWSLQSDWNTVEKFEKADGWNSIWLGIRCDGGLAIQSRYARQRLPYVCTIEGSVRRKKLSNRWRRHCCSEKLVERATTELFSLADSKNLWNVG